MQLIKNFFLLTYIHMDKVRWEFELSNKPNTFIMAGFYTKIFSDYQKISFKNVKNYDRTNGLNDVINFVR